MRRIQVLGVGCPACEKLAANAEAAARAVGTPFTLEKVSNIVQIMMFDICTTPALVVDGQVRVVGRVAAVEEIAEMLAENASEI